MFSIYYLKGDLVDPGLLGDQQLLEPLVDLLAWSLEPLVGHVLLETLGNLERLRVLLVRLAQEPLE